MKLDLSFLLCSQEKGYGREESEKSLDEIKVYVNNETVHLRMQVITQV